MKNTNSILFALVIIAFIVLAVQYRLSGIQCASLVEPGTHHDWEKVIDSLEK